MNVNEAHVYETGSTEVYPDGLCEFCEHNDAVIKCVNCLSEICNDCKHDDMCPNCTAKEKDLIAAAPAMLEALEEARRMLKRNSKYQGLAGPAGCITEAIKLAKGE